MSWLRRTRRPGYAVDGVEPYRNSGGWDHYSGDLLAGQAAVAEAFARLPQGPELQYLLYSLGIGTPDGREWTLGFGDESLILFDLSHPGGSDIFEETLTAAPFTESVERVDRNIFAFTTAQMLTADVALAHCIDICNEVFRRLSNTTATSPGSDGGSGADGTTSNGTPTTRSRPTTAGASTGSTRCVGYVPTTQQRP